MTFVDGQRRFLIRRDWWVQPLLFLVGAVRDANSYVTSEGDGLRFGWFFNQSFPLSAVDGAELMRWPWYGGLGWRTNLTGIVAVVASYRGVVAIRFRERQRVAGIIPFVKLRCDRLVVSAREPDDLLAALNRGGGIESAVLKRLRSRTKPTRRPQPQPTIVDHVLE